MIFVLIIAAFGMILLSYYVFNKDLMSPSFLLGSGFLLSFMSTAYNLKDWGMSISAKTVFILCLSMLTFFLGEYAAKAFVPKPVSVLSSNMPHKIAYIDIGIMKLLFCSAICLFGLIMTIVEVQRIAGLNYSEWGNTAYNFKRNIVNENLEGASVRSWVAQLQKLTKVIGFVFVFVFVNNHVALRNSSFIKRLANLKFLIPTVLYCALCVARGGRFDTIAVILTLIFLLYFFWRKRVGWNKEVDLKYIIRILIVFVAILAVFWSTKELVGRQSSDTDIVGYITRYIGGSTADFELYLQDTITQNNGKHETFANLVKNLGMIGIQKDVTISHEFRASPTGIVIGNAYSAVRNYYHDFGIFGVGLMSFLFSFIFGGIYYKLISYTKFTKSRLFMLIWYSSMLYCIVFFFFTDYFFSHIAAGWFVELLFLWLSYYYIMYIKVKLR